MLNNQTQAPEDNADIEPETAFKALRHQSAKSLSLVVFGADMGVGREEMDKVASERLPPSVRLIFGRALDYIYANHTAIRVRDEYPYTAEEWRQYVKN